jgi:CelD/BcsL family acetyltransferase involved in cellulose biosynthesis
MFHIETTHDLESLLGDHELWNDLARGVPFRETSWLAPWWRQFGADKQAHVLVARDDSNVIRGLLPLYRSGKSDRGGTLSMIGDGEAYSDYVSVLASEDDSVQVAEEMGRYLTSTVLGEQGWDLIDIDGVVEGDAPMAALARELKAGGAGLHTQSRMSTWFKPRDASWEAHLKHHGKTQRRRMRRMSEKINDGGCMQKLVAETDMQVDELLGALIDMHQRRWNDAGESGSYADTRFCDFILESAKEFRRRGRLYLVAIKHEGRIIGGELNMIGGNRVLYSYSIGYDIEAAKLETGRILCVDTLRHLYRENLEGVDYMRGDEEYKKRVSTSSRRLLRLRAVAPTWLPRLRHAAWCTGFELTQWMRRKTGRPPIDVLDITVPGAIELGTSEFSTSE